MKIGNNVKKSNDFDFASKQWIKKIPTLFFSSGSTFPVHAIDVSM